MLTRFRNDPLVGNVLGLIALFVALGAGAYAAGLDPNSVKSKHIKDGQVKTPDIGPATVNSSHLTPNSLQSELVPLDEFVSDDIDEGSLGPVPEALDAEALDGNDSTDFPGSRLRGLDRPAAQRLRRNSRCHWIELWGRVPHPVVLPRPGRRRPPAGSGEGRPTARPNACGSCAATSTSSPVQWSAAFRRDTPRSSEHSSRSARPTRQVTMDVLANGTMLHADRLSHAHANAEVSLTLDGISWRCGPSGSNGCP